MGDVPAWQWTSLIGEKRKSIDKKKENSHPGAHISIFLVTFLCCCSVTQSCPAVCDPWTVAHQALCPRDFSGKSTGRDAMPSSRGSSWPRDRSCVSCIGKRILYCWASREAWLSLCAYTHAYTKWIQTCTKRHGQRILSKGLKKKTTSARVQPRLIQGIRSGDGVGEGKDTIASIRY